MRHYYHQGWNCRGSEGFDPKLSFQPPYSLLFFNYHDFSRALLTFLVIFRNSKTDYHRQFVGH